MEATPHFRVLGPVRADGAGEALPTGSPQQRALLAALLLRPGRSATAAELIDALWGDAPPSQALAAIRTYASRLRKTVGAGVLVSESGGYTVRFPGPAVDHLDLAAAEEWWARAERARDIGDRCGARVLVNRALALWEGEPLAGVPGPYAAARRARLEEWRLQLLETRLDMDLDVGCHADTVAELTALIADHPLRERLRELQMLALYRSGRQAEALGVYAATRRLLADELGVEPGPALADLQRRVLQGDPDLNERPTPEELERAAAETCAATGGGAGEASAPGGGGCGPGPLAPGVRPGVVPRQADADPDLTLPVPAQLPLPADHFTGRRALVSELSRVLASAGSEGGDGSGDGGRGVSTGMPVVVLTGIGGVGKSALALHVAHAVREHFPGGQLYADLEGTGYDPAWDGPDSVDPTWDDPDPTDGADPTWDAPNPAVPAARDARARPAAYRSVAPGDPARYGADPLPTGSRPVPAGTPAGTGAGPAAAATPLAARAVGQPPVSPSRVLAAFLRALGVPPQAVPGSLAERSALFRSVLAGRRVLLVLDHARDAAQVAPLLPGTAGCAVVVTGRARLPELGAAHPVDLDVLSPEESLRFFTRIVGEERVRSERQAALDTVAACGFLPLALRIAGTRLAARPTWAVSVLAAKLADENRRLDELRTGALSVGAALARGQERLSPAQCRAFRQLSLAGRDIPVTVASAVLGLPTAAAEDLLESLVDLSLLESAAPGRYRYHPLVRLYARALAGHAAGSHHGVHRTFMPGCHAQTSEPPVGGRAVRNGGNLSGGGSRGSGRTESVSGCAGGA